MTDWSNRLQEFVNEIAASVAVVGRSASDELVIDACNGNFFDMIGGRRPGARKFPIPFDTMVPSYARREFHQKLMECFNSGTAQELEQAYDFKDGTHWWRLSLKPLRHTDGGAAVLEILVTGLDVTPKMQLTQQLQLSTSRFRSVVDAAYDAIITIDQQHNITLFNRAAENLFGYDQSEVIGKPITQLIPERFRNAHPGYVHHFAQSPVNSRQMDERNRIYGQHRDGSLVPVEIAISKINVGGLLEFTAVISDVAVRARLMDLVQKQAVTDELTGLPNRREFLDVMENMLASSGDLSIFMLDVDHFKKVNDTYGHDAGDDVLRALAGVAKASSRQMDIFARLGGEEFVAALPETALEKAREIAENLRERFEKQDFEYTWSTSSPIPFTVSIGVTTRVPGENDVGAILKRADQALYKAKETGRNRVEVG